MGMNETNKVSGVNKGDSFWGLGEGFEIRPDVQVEKISSDDALALWDKLTYHAPYSEEYREGQAELYALDKALGDFTTMSEKQVKLYKRLIQWEGFDAQKNMWQNGEARNWAYREKAGLDQTDADLRLAAAEIVKKRIIADEARADKEGNVYKDPLPAEVDLMVQEELVKQQARKKKDREKDLRKQAKAAERADFRKLDAMREAAELALGDDNPKLAYMIGVAKEAHADRSLSFVDRSRKIIEGGLAGDDLPVQSRGPSGIQVPLNCTENIAFILRHLFGWHGLFFSEYSNNLQDSDGELVDERWGKIGDLIRLIRMAGIGGVKPGAVVEAAQVIARRPENRFNDLAENFRAAIPQWDQTERCATMLHKLLRCRDDEQTRTLSQYFFMSHVMRVIQPGCYAPVFLGFFGRTDSGKSNLPDLMCKFVETTLGKNRSRNLTRGPGIKHSLATEMCQAGLAASIDLQQNSDEVILRSITGHTTIARIPESRGRKQADVNRVKDFVAKGRDQNRQLFGRHEDIARQWIGTLDSNSFVDFYFEDHERRWAPIFVDELIGSIGKIRWDEGSSFQADYSNFWDDFWQMAAETLVMFEEGGIEAWTEIAVAAKETAKDIFEMEHARGEGGVQSEVNDEAVSRALLRFADHLVASPKDAAFGDWGLRSTKKGESDKVVGSICGLLIPVIVVKGFLPKGSRVTTPKIGRILGALGCSKASYENNKLGYVMEGLDQPRERRSVVMQSEKLAAGLEDVSAKDLARQIANDSVPDSTVRNMIGEFRERIIDAYYSSTDAKGNRFVTLPVDSTF